MSPRSFILRSLPTHQSIGPSIWCLSIRHCRLLSSYKHFNNFISLNITSRSWQIHRHIASWHWMFMSVNMLVMRCRHLTIPLPKFKYSQWSVWFVVTNFRRCCWLSVALFDLLAMENIYFPIQWVLVQLKNRSKHNSPEKLTLTTQNLCKKLLVHWSYWLLSSSFYIKCILQITTPKLALAN